LQTVARRYLEADALILVTPEYNGSYSPTLKHFLDFFPKQARKTFGIVTASPGAFGGLRATQQLLLLVPALFGIACPQMLVVPHVTKHFSETGLLQDEQFRGAVDNFTEEFLWLAEAVNAKKINS
jgi:NAD(P)H-dependent FMN reductase